MMMMMMMANGLNWLRIGCNYRFFLCVCMCVYLFITFLFYNKEFLKLMRDP